MDEKWVFTIKTRAFCKVVPGWGVNGNDSHVQHKSHVGKEMYIVVTAFVLKSNDVTKGGRAIPVSCIRVGKMVKAARDSYRRQYKGDGTFHYPKIAGNLLRKKGVEYFTAVELVAARGRRSNQRCLCCNSIAIVSFQIWRERWWISLVRTEKRRYALCSRKTGRDFTWTKLTWQGREHCLPSAIG